MIDQRLRDGAHHRLVLLDERQRFLVAVLDESRDARGGAAHQARDPARIRHIGTDIFRRGVAEENHFGCATGHQTDDCLLHGRWGEEDRQQWFGFGARDRRGWLYAQATPLGRDRIA